MSEGDNRLLTEGRLSEGCNRLLSEGGPGRWECSQVSFLLGSKALGLGNSERRCSAELYGDWSVIACFLLRSFQLLNSSRSRSSLASYVWEDVTVFLS